MMPGQLEIVANGFLPTRGSVMLDFVFLAIFGVALVLTWSIYLVRVKRNYLLHKRVQLATSVVVLITLVAFEVDLRFFTNWRELAEKSRFFDSGLVQVSLWVHLTFAIPTPLLWLATVVLALKRFPTDPKPGAHSKQHRWMGRLSAFFMYMTALTGGLFYVLGFIF